MSVVDASTPMNTTAALRSTSALLVSIAAARNSMEPTDRSIPDVMITYVIPTDMMISGLDCTAMLRKFATVAKPS